CTLRWPQRQPPWRLPGAARVRRRRLPGPCKPADGPCACKGHRSGRGILAVYLGSACRTSGAIMRPMRVEVQGRHGNPGTDPGTGTDRGKTRPATPVQKSGVSWPPAGYLPPATFQEREVTVGEGEWKLPGTLTVPVGAAPFPAAVLVL